MKRFLLALPIAMLASCGTSGVTMSPEAKRQTIAQGVLNRDVLNTMSLSESAWGRGCSSPRVTALRLVSPPKQDKQSITKAIETWTVDRCGTAVQYRVEFAETPGMGTQIGVKLIK